MPAWRSLEYGGNPANFTDTPGKIFTLFRASALINLPKEARQTMTHPGRSLALALIIFALAMPARGADNPGGDPGDELKQGFVSLGHGIRDGAVKTWGAVKSVFN